MSYRADGDLLVTSRSVNGGKTISRPYDKDGPLIQAGDLTLSRSPQNGTVTGSVLANRRTTWVDNGLGEVVSETATHSGMRLYSAAYAKDKLGWIIKKPRCGVV